VGRIPLAGRQGGAGDADGLDHPLSVLEEVAIEALSEIRATLGIATEHDQARPLRVIKRVTLGIATEKDAALPLKVA
jgi:hypothetical protein